MFLIVFAYFFVLTLIFLIIYKLKDKTKPLPKLMLTKSGLVFNSCQKHKIFVGDVKLMQIENCAYLKKDDKMIVVKNVSKTYLKKRYFYFTALGEIDILFKCKSYYRLFNINIKSTRFNLAELKQQALTQLANNLFNINNCHLVKRYLYLVKEILNVNADENKIQIKQNKYFLPFSVSYKVKSTLKTIKVNQ